MALTPPTYMELGTFRNESYTPEEAAHVTAVLQQATDAIWVTTGLEDYPSDERGARVTRYAIMDFSLWLIAQEEHRDEINSPFSGERIGSYSYQKMQQAARGEETGIYWLDMLFTMLNSGDDTGTVWSERVFNPEGLTYEQQRAVEKAEMKFADPASVYWSG